MLRRLVLSIALLGLAGAALAQPAPPLTRIAFGSCADEEKPQPIWDAVGRYRPELFLFTRDNVYGDVRGGQVLPEADLLDGLRHAYAQAQSVPGFMAVKTGVRHLATWDDHDYGRNDAGADFAGRHEAQKLLTSSGTCLPTTRAGTPRASTTPKASGRRASACRSSCSTRASSAHP